MNAHKQLNSITPYLISLCETTYSSNHQEESDFAPAPIPDFESLSPRSLLRVLQTEISSLLYFKSNFFQTEPQELSSEICKLETCMQTRESQIRKQLKAQYELRVSLQDRKWELEELETNEEEYKKKTERLEKQIDVLKVPKKFDEKKIRNEMAKKVEELKRSIARIDEKMEKGVKNNEELKSKLEEKNVEFTILKKEKRRMDNLALVLMKTPDQMAIEELQPNPECSIFLSPLIEKSERKKSELQPRHKRANTGNYEQSKFTEWLSPDPVLVKQEVPKLPTKVPRKSLFHRRTYSKLETKEKY